MRACSFNHQLVYMGKKNMFQDFVTVYNLAYMLPQKSLLIQLVHIGKIVCFQDFVTVFNLAYCCHKSHFLAETDHNPPIHNSYFNYLVSNLPN